MGWLRGIEVAAGVRGIKGEELAGILKRVKQDASAARKKHKGEGREMAAEHAAWMRYGEELRNREGGKA